MNGNLPSLAYLTCGGLILLYAWERFNTPASNRSSTRQGLYWWSCIGYMASALGVFSCLSYLLQEGPWRTALLGSVDNSSLPAPLIATLAMTTLLSAVPPLKQLDGWILSAFHSWAEIPAEVKRRAATMVPHSFYVTEEDVSVLRETYGDGSYGDNLARHLRVVGCEGLEKSQYSLTRVVKLYDQIRKLAGETRYSRFFIEAGDEFAALERNLATFLRQADASLSLAARLLALDTQDIYKELMQERRDAFAMSSKAIFQELVLFLARAVLRSETSEKDIVNRLRAVGFATTAPMNLPTFPIDSLTVLALIMFLFLAAMSALFAHVPGIPHRAAGGLLMPCKIALARLFSVGVTVWLLQNYSAFRRLPGHPPRFFAYILCGVIAGAASAVICLVFRLGDVDPLPGVARDLPVILLSGMLCAAVAFCCDEWTDEADPPAWLRLAEAIGCGSVMAIGAALVFFAGWVPSISDAAPAWMLMTWIGMPSVMAVVIGGWVPHIYRATRLTDKVQRGETYAAPDRTDATSMRPTEIASPNFRAA